MFGLGRSAADVDGGRVNLVDAEQMEPEAGAHDVADGIHRADFVEVDFLDRYAVDFGFRLTELLEHACAGLFDGFGKLRRRRSSSRMCGRWRCFFVSTAST